MKKLIFGCTLMLCGIIGAIGQTVALTSLVQPGAWSSVMNIFFDGIDSVIIILFFALAFIGAVIAIKALKEDK